MPPMIVSRLSFGRRTSFGRKKEVEPTPLSPVLLVKPFSGASANVDAHTNTAAEYQPAGTDEATVQASESAPEAALAITAESATESEAAPVPPSPARSPARLSGVRRAVVAAAAAAASPLAASPSASRSGGKPRRSSTLSSRSPSHSSALIWSKSPRSALAAPESEKVMVEVGGVRFATTSATLAKAEYFRKSLKENADKENGSSSASEPRTLFVDRDPDVFRLLLSCLRHDRVILPEGDADLFRRALLDAIFYGYVWLLEEVKAAVIDHLGLPAAKAIMATYNRAHPGKPMRARKKREKARLFDVKWASLDAAFDPATGCLPSLFFRKADAAHAAKAAAAARWSSVQHETCPSRGQPALLKALDAVRGAAAASAARDEDSPPPPTPPPPRPPPPPPPCSQGKGCRPRERLPLSPLEEWAHFMADYD
mmetsp:Transcript_18226/g.58707  ORF Transcript_18226/g.58707 Transcript_18226/m.58707 type:complete len:427 (+) Transcript_18226:130-1410(+)